MTKTTQSSCTSRYTDLEPPPLIYIVFIFNNLRLGKKDYWAKAKCKNPG